MQGGDLYSALQSNAQGIGVAHPLSWWRRGRSVALDIARGLHFLHSEHVVRLEMQSQPIAAYSLELRFCISSLASSGMRPCVVALLQNHSSGEHSGPWQV